MCVGFEEFSQPCLVAYLPESPDVGSVVHLPWGHRVGSPVPGNFAKVALLYENENRKCGDEKMPGQEDNINPAQAASDNLGLTPLCAHLATANQPGK